MSWQFLELFVLDDDVATLEYSLSALSAQARLPGLIALAWHLRQRDCHRALQLADEAAVLLASPEVEQSARRSIEARLLLLRAEVKLLFAELASATALCDEAMAIFEQLSDGLGMGDAYWLRAAIALDSGYSDQAVKNLDTAVAVYARGDDQRRIDAARARGLANKAFVDTNQAVNGLADHFSELSDYYPSIACWLAMCRGNIAGLTNDPGAAIKFDIQAYQGCMASGQLRQAMICAINAAEGFISLSELDGALEWSERSLDMARIAGWPSMIALSLMQAGNVLRLLTRFGEADTFLQEAHRVIGAVPGSRNHEQILGNLGQLALDVGKDEEALSWFVQFEHDLTTHNESDLLMESLAGQATALLRLGRKTEALTKVRHTLRLAREKGNTERQIKALRIYAELYRDDDLCAEPTQEEPTAELHYLKEAQRIADSMSGYEAPVELLNEIAGAYARSGDYQAAYEYGLKANSARNAAKLEEAQRRALAMQIRHEVDRARADAENLRTLTNTLQETNTTLETLGRIGREITASLDADAVFDALHRNVNLLLDAHSFVIYLLDVDSDSLVSAFYVESGVDFPPTRIALDNPNALAARCARERSEIVINDEAEIVLARIVPGTTATMSALFAPLEVGSRLLGVMTIQSVKSNAYAERDTSIFRTLCAYGAIALDNAAAYSAVEAARAQSARQQQELRIAAAAFESQEGMYITDVKLIILRVNSAFTNITGYDASEVIGKRPMMFRSDHHSAEFYTAIYSRLESAGKWQGEIWTRRKSGEVYPIWASITAVYGEDEIVTHYVFAIVDITDRKAAEEEIRSLAFYDPLTNLPNRRLLMDRLRHALATSARNDAEGALLFVDLDNFKRLNDTRGHDVGDMLLAQVAQRLSGCLREGDTVARLGGDEFVVLLEGLSNEARDAAERAEWVAEKVLNSLNQPYLLDDKEHHSTPSIGVCLFKGQGVSVDDLLKQADLAMYQSKAAGRNAIRFFDPEMQAAVSANASLEADMRIALAEAQFILYYQPQVDSYGRIIGAEALVRWRHPERGMVSPADFIPLAEETGLILPLGQWVLETACKQLYVWSQRPETSHLSIAVNISARQCHHASFVEKVLTTIADTGANPHHLKLELTESLLLKDIDGIIAKMRALIPLGVRFSLDDFGTGYSSLSYLKRLPLEQLKIDQSFVRDIFVDSNDLAIVRAIVTLGQSLGLSVIAEGVETDDQRQFLESCGCHTFQGYLFGRPAPANEMANKL